MQVCQDLKYDEGNAVEYPPQNIDSAMLPSVSLFFSSWKTAHSYQASSLEGNLGLTLDGVFDAANAVEVNG
jgi:hypothetical protein